MNKKGQGFGFIRIIAFIGMFLLLFALAIAPIVSTMLGVAPLNNAGTTGSWLLGNMNIWFFLSFVIFIIGLLVWGFRE